MPGATPIEESKTPPLTTSTRKPCSFLSLPPEVRCIIYDFVGSERQDCYRAYRRQLASLLGISKEIYKDIVPYLYGGLLVRLSLPKHLPAENRDTFALSHVRRMHLEICNPLGAEESMAGISGIMRNCPALQEFDINISYEIDDKEYGKLVLALLSVPLLAPFPVPQFRIVVYTDIGFGGRTKDRCSLNESDEKEIPDSEIRAHLPTATETALQKIGLHLSLSPREFKTLVSRRLGEWHMVGEEFGWVAGSIALSWEKMREGVDGEVQQALRSERNLDMFSQEMADWWYERVCEA